MPKFLFILTLLMLFFGCTEERIIDAPAELERYAVTITGLPETITDFEGVQVEFSFAVTVENENGLAATGKTVELSILTGEGAVTPSSVTTDRTGRVQALYTAQIPQGEASTQILANVEGFTSTTTIMLQGRNRPVDIMLNADHQRVVVLPEENCEINITATVVDADGVGIPDVALRASLLPVIEEEDLFGFIVPAEPTDSNGQTLLTFNSDGGTGFVILHCAIDHPDAQLIDIQSVISLEVDLLQNHIHELRINAIPDHLEPAPDSVATSEVRVVALDEVQHGIAGLPIAFRTEIGLIDREAVTDENGVAIARFSNNYEYGIAIITAHVPGVGWDVQTQIEIYSIEMVEYRLTLNTDRRFIWPDNGLTYANLTAVLKDENDRGVAGEEIQFSSTYGVVQSPVVTDSMGVVRTIFTDTGTPSPDSVVVTARSQARDVSAEVRIMIRERNPVSTINLHVNARQLRANSGDSTAVRATCYLGDASPAPEGTEVHFSAVYGSFTHSIVTVQGGSGSADTWYIAGNQVTTDTLTAFVWTPDDTAYSNEYLLDLVSGPPAVIVVRANPTELITNDPVSYSEITATVMDTSGNPVRQGTYVTFETTLGTITPSAITDEQGDAIARLTPGTEAGLAHITATTQGRSGPIAAQATVIFISGAPHSIELSADPLEISVVGTGGNSSSTITTTVRDPNGNLIQHPATVVFEMVNEPPPPAGCTIGGDNQVFASQTSNGVAVAALNAGEQIGGKLIRVYTWPDSANDPEHIIVAIFCNVMVVSGPPFQNDIDVDGNGEDVGGGAWSVEVSARVWDLHRNPVADRIPVIFFVDPEIANIDNGYTGNEDRYGRAVQGVAYADLVYLSIDTYSDIEISTEIETQYGQIDCEREYVLPLQQGELTLHVDPANWMFDDENQAEIRCWASLMDGHRILINNAPILFTSSRGSFYWFDFSRDRLVAFFPDVARKFTGLVDRNNNEAPGQATVFLICTEDDVFIDPFQNQMSVNIEACVENLNVRAEPRFVIFTRR